MKQKIVLATTNSSKINSFIYAWNKQNFSDKYQLLTFKDIKNKLGFNVEENTKSFEKDALKKAIEYSKYLNLPAISIDRGIEIPSLNNWPGTESKNIFQGNSEETKKFIKSNRDQKNNEIEIAQYVIDKIKDINRQVNSLYGIAISLPNSEYASNQVIIKGTASKKLVITDVGWNYDWFYIPNNLNRTLSQLTETEYIKFTGTYLWPITNKIIRFINTKI